jgi:hypothetical protein
MRGRSTQIQRRERISNTRICASDSNESSKKERPTSYHSSSPLLINWALCRKRRKSSSRVWVCNNPTMFSSRRLLRNVSSSRLWQRRIMGHSARDRASHSSKWRAHFNSRSHWYSSSNSRMLRITNRARRASGEASQMRKGVDRYLLELFNNSSNLSPFNRSLLQMP